MALELLDDEYWKGNITRRYHYELEAFVWMLPFVFLAYDNGKFDPTTRFIMDWMTSDHSTCCIKKNDFAGNKLFKARAMVKGGFKDYKALMVNACLMVHDLHLGRRRALALVDDPMDILTPALYVEYSAVIWDAFVSVLSTSGIDTTSLREHRPVFESTCNQGLFKEIKGIYGSARRMHSLHVS